MLETKGKLYEFSYKRGVNIGVETAFVFFDVETLVNSDVDGEKITVVAYEVYHYQLGEVVERTILINKKTTNIDINRENVLYFENQQELIKYFTDMILNLMKLFRRVIVVSHNFHFDRIAIDMKRIVNSLDLDFVNFDRTFFMEFRKYQARKLHLLIFNDNMNYFPIGLKHLGKVFGLKKGKTNYDNPTEEIIDYVFRDVEILRESHLYVVNMVKKELNKDVYYLTLASVSMAIFDKYISDELFYHTNKDIKLIERASYKGGRNENRVFGVVKGKIYRLDVNSEYPYMMITKEFPLMPVFYADYENDEFLTYNIHNNKRLLSTYKKVDANKLLKLIEEGEYLAIIDATIDLMDDVIGVRADVKESKIDLDKDILKGEVSIVDPYAKGNWSLLFPIGKNIRVVITSPELIEFKDRIRIKQIHKIIIYKKGNPFRKFVPKFYGERIKSKIDGVLAKDLFYKLLLNTLSGKFAQHSKTDIVIKLDFDPFPERDFVVFHNLSTGETYKKIFGKTFLVLSDDEYTNTKSTIAVSSFISAYGRIYLTKLIQLVEKNGGKVYYYDTDSLHVDEKGFKILKEHGYIASKYEIGKLKIEGVYDMGIYITNKQYVLLEKDGDAYKVDITFGGIPLRVLLQYLHDKGIIWNKVGVSDYNDYYIHNREFDFDILVNKNRIKDLFLALLYLDIEYEDIAKTKETLNLTTKNTLIITRRKFSRDSIKLKRIYKKKCELYYESEPYIIS